MKSGIIHSERKSICGFSESFKRTEMQVLVPGVSRDTERVILIITCHSIQRCTFKVWRQGSIIT